MTKLKKRLAGKFRRAFRFENGAASVEFVIVFPFFFGVFISSFEIGMMNIRALLLERATDLVVREIRLNSGPGDRIRGRSIGHLFADHCHKRLPKCREN